MNDREKKAFDFAADLTKQLITLSTSIVTLTLLFSKDVRDPKWLAVLIWSVFLFSTMFGLLTLMMLTGTLAPLAQSRPLPDAGAKKDTSKTDEQETVGIGRNVRLASGLQIGTFALAVILTIFYVPIAMARQKPAEKSAACNCPCGKNTAETKR